MSLSAGMRSTIVVMFVNIIAMPMTNDAVRPTLCSRGAFGTSPSSPRRLRTTARDREEQKDDTDHDVDRLGHGVRVVSRIVGRAADEREPERGRTRSTPW